MRSFIIGCIVISYIIIMYGVIRIMLILIKRGR